MPDATPESQRVFVLYAQSAGSITLLGFQTFEGEIASVAGDTRPMNHLVDGILQHARLGIHSHELPIPEGATIEDMLSTVELELHPEPEESNDGPRVEIVEFSRDLYDRMVRNVTIRNQKKG